MFIGDARMKSRNSSSYILNARKSPIDDVYFLSECV